MFSIHLFKENNSYKDIEIVDKDNHKDKSQIHISDRTSSSSTDLKLFEQSRVSIDHTDETTY